MVGLGPECDYSWVADTMSHLACAGHTAPDLEDNCVAGFEGLVANPLNSSNLYLYATDAAGLQERLQDVVSNVCCDCSVD